MSVEVRPARRGDLGAILALEEATFPEETYGEIALRQFIDLFPTRFLVAESAETVAGYALGGIDDAGEGWLLSLGVSPAFQGQGIGTRLLGAVLAALDDAPVIRLTVLPGNDHAVALYEKNGFSTEALRPDYYGPGQDRLVMVRTR
ncbi:GNAT family N-acetyltransferase [Novosphingobium decolorationis]|uniref:GNAT family N-acetyltransferase n=1 Tax=Novosphingobium decolorationis TaxID=2698673 RepID=A0ABX8E9J9_9SPHN|nr:GNAT family N-acetyltransferase [Novosphingobium decolorationis]MED5547125.1 GNAT family N-acetyltransferase [Pseudomonadota bacterium]QVM85827.1 GNAT family N-acetyltransferase [Novosphingobium decolorationis]